MGDFSFGARLWLLLAVAIALPARADIPALTLYTGASGGGHLVLDTWDIGEVEERDWRVSPGHGGIVKARAGFVVLPDLSLELGLGFIPAPADDINMVLAYELDAIYVPYAIGDWAPFVDLGVGYYHNTTADIGGYDLDFQFRVGAGVRWRFRDWVSLRAEVRHVMSDPIRTALLPVTSNVEVTVGADFPLWSVPLDPDGDGIESKGDACPEQPGPAITKGCPDADRDAIPDSRDRCPEDKGPSKFKGCPDSDGDGLVDVDDECRLMPGPKELQGCPLADEDGDEVPDEEDACPETPGLERHKGCPDSDGDDIIDSDDRCPGIVGIPEQRGCPDVDGDGIIDGQDLCPDKAGEDKWEGCPSPTDDVAFKFSGPIEGIDFDPGTARLLQSSKQVLQEVADLLLEWPGLRLRIESHTSNVGKAEQNLALTIERAKLVRQFLIRAGVAPEQLEAVGHGGDKPITFNHTERGRKINERIEMHIVQP